MPKVLYQAAGALVVMWIGSAMPLVEASDGVSLTPAVLNVRSPAPVALPSVADVRPTGSFVTPSMSALGGPADVLSRNGGTELLGSVIGIGLVLRYVRRRRFV